MMKHGEEALPQRGDFPHVGNWRKSKADPVLLRIYGSEVAKVCPVGTVMPMGPSTNISEPSIDGGSPQLRPFESSDGGSIKCSLPTANGGPNLRRRHLL